MTRIPVFGATASQGSRYAQTHKALLAEGSALDGTARDRRAHLQGVTAFRKDQVDIYTNQSKNQVVMAQKVGADQINPDYTPSDGEGKVREQTYRSVMKPDRFGVLHVTERVDSRDAEGKLLGSWQREVQTDPDSNGFAILMP